MDHPDSGTDLPRSGQPTAAVVLWAAVVAHVGVEACALAGQAYYDRVSVAAGAGTWWRWGAFTLLFGVALVMLAPRNLRRRSAVTWRGLAATGAAAAALVFTAAHAIFWRPSVTLLATAGGEAVDAQGGLHARATVGDPGLLVRSAASPFVRLVEAFSCETARGLAHAIGLLAVVTLVAITLAPPRVSRRRRVLVWGGAVVTVVAGAVVILQLMRTPNPLAC